MPGDDPRVVARDYEYAGQIGTIKAWDAFLTTHPNGFHADLAREQKGKLESAEQAHAKAEEQRQRAEDQAKGKADQFRKQLEEQAAKQAEEAKKQADRAGAA